jgi:hypothetical protein
MRLLHSTRTDGGTELLGSTEAGVRGLPSARVGSERRAGLPAVGVAA